ncbi:hypothetical protein [Paenibacillus montanisoli]|uniref:Uncharacterized protein n=1 Tax=Paenibacillus montanisoli TaxID=2081970 RepID=A0A328U8A4_9BACL|nr:hypothetical protein [Paenibacillus montanisoli]RAP78053.1 hypothetical protein DL346_06310 [Paenibacillus montanisoli]
MKYHHISWAGIGIMSDWNRKQRLNDVFEIALYLVSGFCIVYFMIKSQYPKAIQGILIILVLLFIRGLVKWTQSELFPALRLSVLFFIALAMLFANLFGLYGVIPYLDKIEHLLSGIILCFIGLLIIRKMIRKHRLNGFPSPIAIWFALNFAVAMAGCWEIWEFATDRLFGLSSQFGLTDTMVDIICGTIGAAGTSCYLARKAKRHPLSILSVDENKG